MVWILTGPPCTQLLAFNGVPDAGDNERAPDWLCVITALHLHDFVKVVDPAESAVGDSAPNGDFDMKTFR